MIQILLFLVIINIVMAFIYHQALIEAYEEKGIKGAFAMYIAMWINKVGGLFFHD